MWNPYSLNQPMQPYSQRSGFGTGYGIIRVNGRNGAKMFQMPPNTQALLLDETAPLVWLAQTDGAGYKTLSPYKIEPYQPEAPVDAKALEARVKRLEEMLNGKPDSDGNGYAAGTTAAASAPIA